MAKTKPNLKQKLSISLIISSLCFLLMIEKVGAIALNEEIIENSSLKYMDDQYYFDQSRNFSGGKNLTAIEQDEALQWRNLEHSMKRSPPPHVNSQMKNSLEEEDADGDAGHSRFKKLHPNVTQADQSEFFSDVGFLKEMIDAIFEGLGLNALLGNEEVCFEQVEHLLWHVYYTYDGYFESNEAWNATISMTFALSEISPVMRNCYSFSQQNEGQWIALGYRLFSLSNLWNDVKQNLIDVHEDVDNASWGSFIKTSKGDYINSVRYSSRLIYLIYLRGLDNWIQNSTNVTVQSSAYNQYDDPFLNLLRLSRHGDPEQRQFLLEQYLSEKRLQLHKDSIQNMNDGKVFTKHPLVGQNNDDATSVFGENNSGTSRGYFMYPIWPYPYTVNQVHLVMEMAYEFMRGSRLATTNQLQLCETPVSHQLESMQAAIDYAQLGTSTNDEAMVVEGVFRVADTLQWSTPIMLGCDLTTRYIFLTLMSEVVYNFSNPWRLFLNVIKNNFNIVTDSIVIMADAYFDDIFSLSFWAGDIFYNLAVMQPIA